MGRFSGLFTASFGGFLAKIGFWATLLPLFIQFAHQKTRTKNPTSLILLLKPLRKMLPKLVSDFNYSRNHHRNTNPREFGFYSLNHDEKNFHWFRIFTPEITTENVAEVGFGFLLQESQQISRQGRKTEAPETPQKNQRDFMSVFSVGFSKVAAPKARKPT